MHIIYIYIIHIMFYNFQVKTVKQPYGGGGGGGCNGKNW